MMYREEYLERNIERLFGAAELELKLPEAKRQQILANLIAAGGAGAMVVPRRIFLRRVLQYAAAAVVIIAGLIAADYLLNRLTERAGEKIVKEEKVERKSAEKVVVKETMAEEKLAAKKREVEQLFAAKDIAGLITMLDKGQMQTKIAAANYLAEIGDISAIGALEKLSKQWDETKGENPFAGAIEKIKAKAARPDVNEPNQAPEAQSKAEKSALYEQTGPGMLVLVLSKESGEAIADAEIKVRINRQERGSRRTNKNGICWIEFNDVIPESMRLSVSRAGFVPVMFSWGKDRDIPDEFTFRLDKGTFVGGKVVNEEGEAIEGANVKIGFNDLPSREEPWAYIESYSVKTDKDGKWTADMLPARLELVGFEPSHPDYAGVGELESRLSSVQFTPEQLRAQTAVMVMKRGITLYGYVTDQAGKPVEGASVIQGYDMFSSRPRTVSDVNGRFEFPHSQEGQIILTVEANGFAPELKDAAVHKGMTPVEFVLGPAKKIFGRVVDVNGNPIAGVSLTSQQWRGYQTLVWSALTDAEGRFVLDGAPADEVMATADKQGYTGSDYIALIASDKEQVIVLYNLFTVSGKVLDANTKEPIEKFNVLPGAYYPADAPIVWQDAWRTTGQRGEFTLNITSPAAEYVLKIEADGYLPAQSRRFAFDEKQVALEIALERIGRPTGVVYLPDGNIAPQTEIYIVKKGPPLLVYNSTGPGRMLYENVVTDSYGQFWMMRQAEPFRFVALHDKGIAEVSQEQFERSSQIRLLPWGRVEGTIYSGSRPAPDLKVRLFCPTSKKEPGGLNCEYIYDAKTDGQGIVSFERVRPGTMRLAHIQEGGVNSYDDDTVVGDIEVLAGQTVKVRLGGGGRPVIGRFVMPQDAERFAGWACTSGAIKGLSPDAVRSAKPYEEITLPRPQGFAEMTASEILKWYGDWQKQKPGRQWAEQVSERKAQKYRRSDKLYSITIMVDGSFRADDVAAGEYLLEVTNFANEQPGYPHIGEVDYEFAVPPAEPGDEDAQVDIGVISLLKPLGRLEVNEPAPDFEVEGFDGGKIRLSDYAGKFVLIEFWTVAQAFDGNLEMQDARRIGKRFANDERFKMLWITLAEKEGLFADIARKLVKENDFGRHNGLADYNNSIWKAYSFPQWPWYVLINPDGKVMAVGGDAEKVESVVMEALGQ